MENKKIDINNASNPLRQKAIGILETISEKMGNEDVFDGEKWYDLEDSIVEILVSKNTIVENVADILKSFNKMDEEDREGDFNRTEFLLGEFAYLFEDKEDQFNETKFRQQVLGIK